MRVLSLKEHRAGKTVIFFNKEVDFDESCIAEVSDELGAKLIDAGHVVSLDLEVVEETEEETIKEINEDTKEDIKEDEKTDGENSEEESEQSEENNGGVESKGVSDEAEGESEAVGEGAEDDDDVNAIEWDSLLKEALIDAAKTHFPELVKEWGSLKKEDLKEYLKEKIEG